MVRDSKGKFVRKETRTMTMVRHQTMIVQCGLAIVLLALINSSL